jgi:hypothetical protein
MDIKLIKVRAGNLSPDSMVFAPQEEESLPTGVILNAHIQKVPETKSRSYEQLCLYKQAVKYVANNTENLEWCTPEKVDEQVKIACRFYETFIWYENSRTGERTLNVKTRSVSYNNLGHAEACKFFEQAFKTMALFLGMDEDTFVTAVKESVGELSWDKQHEIKL